jgi:hypothetical protein
MLTITVPAGSFGSDGIAELFIKIDYDDELIQAFLNSHTATSEVRRLDDPLSYTFDADLSQVVIAVNTHAEG